jgi:hypothetical protein
LATGLAELGDPVQRLDEAPAELAECPEWPPRKSELLLLPV